MSLTDRQRKILKVVGLVALALMVFFFALARTFPYDRLKDRLIAALSTKYDVTIGEIRPGLFPGDVVIESFQLQTRPTKADEKPTTIFFDEVEVDIGLLALLRRHYDVDIVAKVTGGQLEADVLLTKSALKASVHTEMLPLQGIPGISEAVGLPMAGKLNADFNLELPMVRKGKRAQPKWTQASGHLMLTCASCTIGDGKAQLKMRRPQSSSRRHRRRRMLFAGKGLTVPRLRLGRALVEVDIDQGVGKIKTFSAKSADGRLSIDGELRFAEPFKRSTLPGCMHFKLSDELKKREPKFGNIEFLLPERARQDDGSFAIPTKGRLTMLRWDIKKRCGESAGDTGKDGLRRRPTIRARPEHERQPPAPPELRPHAGSGETIERPPPRTSGPPLGDRLGDAAKAASEHAEHARDQAEADRDGEGDEAEGDDQGESVDEGAEGDREPDEGEPDDDRPPEGDGDREPE